MGGTGGSPFGKLRRLTTNGNNNRLATFGMTGDYCGVFGVVVFEALDLCPCFRRGDGMKNQRE